MYNMRRTTRERKVYQNKELTGERAERKESLGKLSELGKKVKLSLEVGMRLTTVLAGRGAVRGRTPPWALDPVIEGGTMLLGIDPRAWRIASATQMGAAELAQRKRLGMTAFAD